MRAACLLLATVLLTIIATANAGTLYAVVTEFSKAQTETVQYTVSASVNSGKITNVVKNFVIGGSSLTFDGISTFDDKHNVYYYAPDWPAPLVFSADVKKQELLAPIFLGGTSILRVDFDDATDTLYSLVASEKRDKVSGYLVATGPQGSATTVLKFPPEFSFDGISTEVYNGQYWIAAPIKSSNVTSYALAAFNLTDPTSAPTVVHIDCHDENIFVNFIVYDQSENTFYAIAETDRNNKLSYLLWTITPEGNCTSTKMNLPEGIATCYTYDQTGNIAWVGLATDSGSYFYGYNVTIPAIYKSILIGDGVTPSSIEYGSA